MKLFKFSCFLIFLFSSIALSSEKQVEVTNFFAKLYLAPSVNSKFMGLAQKGERYPIILSSNYWYRIQYKGVAVWVESGNIQVIDPNAPVSSSNTENPPETKPGTTSGNTPNPVDSQVQQAPNSPVVAQTETEKNEQVRTTEQARSVEKKSSPKPEDNISETSRLRRWISRQNLSKLPIIEQNIEEKSNDKFFLVTSSPAKILLTLSPDSPILGMPNRGAHLPLIGEGDSWCKVSYQDTVGWIEKKYGKVVTSTSFPIFLNFGIVIIAIAILILSVILLLVIKLMKHKKGVQQDTSNKKKVLIIANESKQIVSALTDTTTTIEKCFQEIDFQIVTATDLATIKTAIELNSPDVILIDWKFDRTIITTIEQLFSSSSKAESIIVIIYNVPDPSSMFANPALPKMAFLGISFSDRDLFKLVTPLMIYEESQNIQKGVQSSALEGEIAGGNLLEVLQYIEQGQKTGCLLIDTGKPNCLIYFNQGRIIYAATADGLIGKDALFFVLDLKEGKFRFMLNRQPKSTNTNLSTLEVLMSWTKNIDETTKHGLRSS